jgi:hypothetical protein
MSRTATDWLAKNMPALKRVTYTDASGKERQAFRGEGFVLAFHFCDASNKYGTISQTRETMSDLSGVSKVEIDRLIPAWIRGGFIGQVGVEKYMGRGKPTPIYALIGIPGEYKPQVIDDENARITIPITIPGDSRNLVKPIETKANDYFLDSEPEPEPDSKSEPDSDSSDIKSVRQEKEGINADEVMRICIELETESMTLRGAPILPGLVKGWKADYSRLIPQAIKDRPGDTADDVAWHCHNLRTEARTGVKAQGSYAGVLPRPAQVRQSSNAPKRVCGRCENKNRDIPGYEGLSTQWDIDPESGSYIYTRCKECNGTGHKELEPTQVPTQERVSTDQADYIDMSTPGGSADPQSGVRDIGDITGQLKRKLARPIPPLAG